ncbi:iron response transcriptional regulator IrrA [Bosea sp. (in: a-proteobacteria)]
MLKRAGLRPTRQRVALGGLLFGDEHRHVTADELHLEAIDAGIPLSLATVYNTLSQFDEAGLIRKVCVNGGKAYYDTDAGDHHHFYIEAEDRIIDIPPGRISVDGLPKPPPGYVITKVDVVIRLERVGAKA